jgi:paraquat-inducible protein A
MDRFRPLILLIASISFGLGISLPLMQFEKLYFFTETPSLITIISGLWTDGEILLAIVVLAFSILFPILKLFTAFQTVFLKEEARGWTAALAKWSMMDVLLVAIAVFAAKTSGLANAVSQPGLWFFAISAIAVAVSVAKIKNGNTP